MLIVDGNNSKNDLLVDLLLLFTMAAPAVTDHRTATYRPLPVSL
jgi:hypothetical protein